MRRLCAALVLLAALSNAAPARGDGDPASDVLLYQDVFLPYAPKVSKPVAAALADTAKRAKAAGFPVKVALIQAKQDLGAYPVLFGRPQRYADLLAVEISFNTRPRILTVMPNGFGARNLGAGAARTLAAIPIDRATRSDGLALAAARGVAALAAAGGHPFRLGPLPAPARADAGSGSSAGTTAALYGAPILLLLAAGAVLALRRRRQPDVRA